MSDRLTSALQRLRKMAAIGALSLAPFLLVFWSILFALPRTFWFDFSQLSYVETRESTLRLEVTRTVNRRLVVAGQTVLFCAEPDDSNINDPAGWAVYSTLGNSAVIGPITQATTIGYSYTAPYPRDGRTCRLELTVTSQVAFGITQEQTIRSEAFQP